MALEIGLHQPCEKRAHVCVCRIPFWDEYKRSRSRLGVSSSCHMAPPTNTPPPSLIPGLNFLPQLPVPAPGITPLMAQTCSLTSSIDPATIGTPGPRRGEGGVCGSSSPSHYSQHAQPEVHLKHPVRGSEGGGQGETVKTLVVFRQPVFVFLCTLLMT